MEEGIFLVHKSTICVEHLGIARIYDVLDDVGELVDLRLDVVHHFILRILFALDPVYPHHVFLSNLVEALAHLDLQLVLKSLEFLDLNKLDVLQRATRRLPPLRIEHLGKQWIGRDVLLDSFDCDWQHRLRVLRRWVLIRLIVTVLILVRVVVHGVDYIFIT